MLLENIKLALSSIWLNRIRSLLTILGVVIGVFAIITIIAIGTGLEEEIVGQVTDLGADVLDIVPGELGEGIGSAVSLQEKFTRDEVESLRKNATLLKGVAEMYQLAGKVSFNDKSINGFVVGTDPLYFQFRGISTDEGLLFNKDHNLNRDKVIVIGNGTAEELFSSPKHAINQYIRVNGIEFKIIGVLEEETLGFGGFNLNQAVYLPALTVQDQFPSVGIMEIMAKVKDKDQINKAKRQVELVIKESTNGKAFTVLSQENMLELVENITGVVTSALAGLAAVSLLVGGIGIMNIMLVSVTERTKEIGIRKAIGATNTHILTQFLTESIILCIVGGVVGLLFAAIISTAITYYFNFPTLINTQTIIGAVGFSMVVGAVFGTAPALKAARKDPVDALRYE